MEQVRQSARARGAEIRRAPLEDAPEGWVYNPSSWAQRVPICVLAFLGFLVAGWITLFQWGVLPTIWEPFFGSGSSTILTSSVSHALSIRIGALTIPDGGLGALGYLADAVFGLAGGPARWKRIP